MYLCTRMLWQNEPHELYNPADVGCVRIFFPIGLNLALYCRYSVIMLIVILIFILQVSLCKWWLASYC